MSWEPLSEAIRVRARPPLAIVLGSPREVVELLGTLQITEATCYQMDLYQAARLREELAAASRPGNVVTAPDLWDVPAGFQTVLFPAEERGERDLKIDMVEQAFHILRPHGLLLVLSPYEKDQLFPGLLKKIFRRVHATVAHGTAFWCRREGERPRRRHEVTFHARLGDAPSLGFLSWPGVFSHGRFDDGSRALVESMRIQAGDHILDMGCGCGTNGIFAAKQAGPAGRLVFVDSNVRAVALAAHNAGSNGIAGFEAIASADMSELPATSFDVVLANPPYYAQGSIAKFFIEKGRALLRQGGRLYLVTKQPDVLAPVLEERFGGAEVSERRGYVVFCACVRGSSGTR